MRGVPKPAEPGGTEAGALTTSALLVSSGDPAYRARGVEGLNRSGIRLTRTAQDCSSRSPEGQRGRGKVEEEAPAELLGEIEERFRERNAEYVAVKERHDALDADQRKRSGELTELESSQDVKYMDDLMQRQQPARVRGDAQGDRRRQGPRSPRTKRRSSRTWKRSSSVKGELETHASHIQEERKIVESESAEVQSEADAATKQIGELEHGAGPGRVAIFPRRSSLRSAGSRAAARASSSPRPIDGTCQSCFVRVRPQVFQEIKARLEAPRLLELQAAAVLRADPAPRAPVRRRRLPRRRTRPRAPPEGTRSKRSNGGAGLGRRSTAAPAATPARRPGASRCSTRAGPPSTSHSGFLGRATNNVAEYRSLIEALKLAVGREARVGPRSRPTPSWSSSRSRASTGSGTPISSRSLPRRSSRIAGIALFRIRHVRRADNKEADRLVNVGARRGRGGVGLRVDRPAPRTPWPGRVRERIGEACVRAGRAADSVRLVAVSKTFSGGAGPRADRLRPRSLRREQASRRRWPRSPRSGPGARWHLIGHLQRNKARQVVGEFELIHGLDGIPLAEELDRRAAAAKGLVQPVLIQLNLAAEQTKFGLAEAELEEAAGRRGRDCPPSSCEA